MKNFRQVFRLTDKDDKIAELEKQVARLSSQSTKLAEEKTQAEQERDAQYPRIHTLGAENFRLTFELTQLKEQSAKLAEEKAALEAENAHLNKTWKFNYDLLLERVEKAEQEVGDLKDANSELGLMHDEMLHFLRSIKSGVFRSDRNGKECYKELEARIVKYDSQMIGK
jgi:regulator of replication initiation timing